MKKKTSVIEKKPDLTGKLDQIFLQDCIEGMKTLPDGSVDLVIADPPYNLSSGEEIDFKGGKVVSGMGGAWKKTMESWDNMSLESYFAFSMSWLSETKRVLKPTGSLHCPLGRKKVSKQPPLIWPKRHGYIDKSHLPFLRR